MANPYFRFKEFTVFHNRCAMKVGTDGVLIGAWTRVENAKTALDVGTGSALIALMLSQRNTSLLVDAIEIDCDAALQAAENVNQSKFADRISVIQTDFDRFTYDNNSKYDLIVANPPFFVKSLKSPFEQRNAARHTDSLSPQELLGNSALLLNPNGCVSVVYPYDCLDDVLLVGRLYKLFPRRICTVYPKPEAPPKRVLIEFAFGEGMCEESRLVIERERHCYSPEFAELTRDFYLEK